MEEEVPSQMNLSAMGEDDSMTSSEPQWKKNQSTEEVQSSENETVTTETTTETPQRMKTLVLHLKQKQILSLKKLVKRRYQSRIRNGI